MLCILWAVAVPLTSVRKAAARYLSGVLVISAVAVAARVSSSHRGTPASLAQRSAAIVPRSAGHEATAVRAAEMPDCSFGEWEATRA